VRNLFFKLLPYAMGLGQCLVLWCLFFPPAFLDPLGLWRVVILLPLLIVAMLASSAVVLAMAFPENPTIERVVQTPPLQMAGVVAGLHELGFESVDPPMRAGLRPPVTIWAYAHREFGCWAEVYCTTTLPQKTGYGFFALFASDAGGLSSAADPTLGMVPVRKGSFKQILPGAAPRQLLMFHLAAQDFLAERGARFDPPVLTDVETTLRRSLARQRRAVTENPLRTAAILLWRSMTKTNPHRGPISEQKAAVPSLRALGLRASAHGSPTTMNGAQ